MFFDVIIVGGGLAGNLLARQISLADASLSVLVLERNARDECGYKVGESTVEIASDFLTRRLLLTNYIYQEHLPKNGLRFFFDSEERSLPIEDMSEIGTEALPPAPSFQLDRHRFERDLVDMNRAVGVDIRFEARVQDIDFGLQNHTVRYACKGKEHEVQGGYLVDASGRASLVANKLGLQEKTKDHKIAAAWGRFRGVGDIDAMGTRAWRRSVGNTARSLSTNHFCYPGYWIWAIPLRHGITSLGLVQRAEQWSTDYHKSEGFLRFLREHDAVASLVENAQCLDFEAFTQLGFRTKQFYGDRWSVIGDAAAFVDPFYSPGSDFISVVSDQTCDLILRAKRKDEYELMKGLYEEFMQFRFESTLLLYKDLYEVFGNYDLMKTKIYFDTAHYYNLWFDSYRRDEHLNSAEIRRLLRRKTIIIAAMKEYAGRFRSLATDLKKSGLYFAKNRDQATRDGREAFGPIENVGCDRPRQEIQNHTMQIFKNTDQMLEKIQSRLPTGEAFHVPSRDERRDAPV